MVVCMKSVQVWCQSLRNKISFSFIFLSSSRSSKLHEADCLAWPPPQKRCAKKLISVANLGFCKIGHFDIDWDSKMPSSGCKLPTLVQKGNCTEKGNSTNADLMEKSQCDQGGRSFAAQFSWKILGRDLTRRSGKDCLAVWWFGNGQVQLVGDWTDT